MFLYCQQHGKLDCDAINMASQKDWLMPKSWQFNMYGFDANGTASHYIFMPFQCHLQTILVNFVPIDMAS